MRTKTYPSIEPLGAELSEKGVLCLTWNGRMFLSLSIGTVIRIAHQQEHEPESITPEEVATAQEFAEAYARVRTKYSGSYYPVIQPNNKHWVHMEKGAKACAEMGVSPTEWCEVLTGTYTDMAGGMQNKIPWPTQLHGTAAITHISNWKAKQTTNPNARAIRRAKLAVGVPLNEDHEYQRIRTRIKKKIHTKEDIAYMRARQIEVYGAEKEWLAGVDLTAVVDKPQGGKK